VPFHAEKWPVVEHRIETLRLSNGFALWNDSSSQPEFSAKKSAQRLQFSQYKKPAGALERL